MLAAPSLQPAAKRAPTMPSKETNKPWEYILRKYLLLLATVVATVTYAAGFNPPGGVWQDTDASHLAGDPIILETHHSRYMVFFCCNAIAFASSLVVIVLILLLALLTKSITVVPLRVVMVLDLLSIMGAYAAGTCRDTLATIYYSLLVTVVFAFPVVLTVLVSLSEGETSDAVDETPAAVPVDMPVDKQVHKQVRKVLMLLATFMVSVTYMAGLSTPGGFWDSTQDGHHAGDAVLQGLHPGRLRAFFVCNTTVFVASLLIIVLLLSKKLGSCLTVLYNCELYGCIILALIGLVGAYASGSTREAHSTIYVGLLVGAVLACILLVAIVVKDRKEQNGLWKAWASLLRLLAARGEATAFGKPEPQLQPGAEPRSPDKCLANRDAGSAPDEQALEKARSLVLLLATLAATVTYQAGLDPPGGFWQDDGHGHKAGDPILLTTNPRRYKVFFFCNSTAFAASLVAIILVERKFFHKSHMQLVALAAMILDLFGLIGAYAAGSCRDVSTSIYVIALAGAVLVYVVIHIVFFTLDHEDDNKRESVDLLEKRRKGLLLFAILGATITYQAGLTPPSGFWPQDDENLGHHAGDPVLFYNYPRRYKAFFYCNSASFMSSIALIILLVNPNLYMTAIRSYALSVCSVAGMFGLIGAYAAGSSQHMRTSIYVFVLVAVVLAIVIPLLLISLGSQNNKKQKVTGNTGDQPTEQGGSRNAGDQSPDKQGDTAREQYTKRKYLMLLGILAASVTYQAGLKPPGGAWQGNSPGHATGDPILRDKRRYRYRAFFYSNSTSFVASIVVIVLLLPEKLQDKYWLLQAMNTTIVLDMLGLLGAYAAGSSRERSETFWYVIALIITVLGYLAIYVVMSLFNNKKGKEPKETPSNPDS